MKKSALYTKTGDSGLTSLVSGNRISKSDLRINLYGEVDELNSIIGLCISYLKNCNFKNSEVNFELILKIQSSLFDLGSNLACELENREKFKLPKINPDLVQLIENEIDQLDQNLPKLKSFILPGGDQAASGLHLARTVCRRVERTLVSFENINKGEIPENALMLLNRLSDYFFVLSRFVNYKLSIPETIWIPNN